jgi:ribosomal protein L37AE/L43A
VSDQTTCVACERGDKVLRECADGKWRCRFCRTLWLEKQHATPVKPVPPSVGQQSSFV